MPRRSRREASVRADNCSTTAANSCRASAIGGRDRARIDGEAKSAPRTRSASVAPARPCNCRARDALDALDAPADRYTESDRFRRAKARTANSPCSGSIRASWDRATGER